MGVSWSPSNRICGTRDGARLPISCLQRTPWHAIKWHEPDIEWTTFVHGGAHSHAVDGSSARTSAVLHARLTSQDAIYVKSKGSERKACFVFLLGGGTARLTDACVCTCARACLYVDRNDAPGSTDDRGRMQLDAGRCERVRKALQTAKSRRS